MKKTNQAWAINSSAMFVSEYGDLMAVTINEQEIWAYPVNGMAISGGKCKPFIYANKEGKVQGRQLIAEKLCDNDPKPDIEPDSLLAWRCLIIGFSLMAACGAWLIISWLFHYFNIF